MSKNEGILEKQIKGMVKPLMNLLNPLVKNGKSVESLTKRSKVKVLKHNNITWLDIENPTRHEMNKLSEIYNFHPLHLDASLLKGQPPQVEKEEKYLFLVLQVPRYDSIEGKILTDQISIFLGKNYVVTIHEEAATVIRNLFKLLRRDKKTRDTCFKRSSGYLLYYIIGNLIKDIEQYILTISQELDEAEDIVFDVSVSGIKKINQLRQKITRLRRILGFLKKTFESLTPIINDVSGDNLSRYYSNIAKIIDKLRDNIEEARETAEIYKDTDFIVSTDKTNEILAVLTIIFTLTIPATVIGTFYGMNILVPGGIDAGSWTFLGPFTTFFFVIGSALTLCILMFFYFRHKKYF